MAKRTSRIIQQYEQKVREAMELGHHHLACLAYTPWEKVEERISIAEIYPGSPEYDQIHALWESQQQQKYHQTDRP